MMRLSRVLLKEGTNLVLLPHDIEILTIHENCLIFLEPITEIKTEHVFIVTPFNSTIFNVDFLKFVGMWEDKHSSPCAVFKDLEVM